MKIFEQLRSFMQFQKLAFRQYRAYPFLMSVVIICNSVFPFIMVIFPRYILDEIFGGRNLITVTKYLIGMAVSLIFIGVLQSVFTNKLHYCSMRIKSVLRMEQAYKTTKIKYDSLEDPEILDMKQQAAKFLEEDVDTAIYLTPEFVSSVLSTLLYVYIIANLNFFIILIIIFTILVNSIIQSRTEKYAFSYRKELAPIERKISYFIMMTPNQKYGKDIRLFNLSGWIHEKYKEQMLKTLKSYKAVFNRRTRDPGFTRLCLHKICGIMVKTQIGACIYNEFTT